MQKKRRSCSHLFQRVASFLLDSIFTGTIIIPRQVLISFREWLHSYLVMQYQRWLIYFSQFSSLSESGFIPTLEVLSMLLVVKFKRSHLFQRVASFLLTRKFSGFRIATGFSSLSESGFIPTLLRFLETTRHFGIVLISFREWLHSYMVVDQSNVTYVAFRFSSLSESGFIPTSCGVSMKQNLC